LHFEVKMKYRQLSIFDLHPQSDPQVRAKATKKTHTTPQEPKKSVIDKIKAISIHAPHAYAICMGKTYEYRNSPTKKRGWVLIHSSSSKASDSFFEDYGIDKKIAARGAIIGASFITDCIGGESAITQHGGYAYRMTRSMLFPAPILGVKGCQAIFWGHCKDPQKIKAFNQALEQMGIDLKVRG
jgi:hypothetical protein